MIQNNQEFKLINSVFPHVGNKLMLFWGEPEFYPYMEGLITSDRDFERQGFPQDIANGLLKLASLHESKYPSKAKADIWEPWVSAVY